MPETQGLVNALDAPTTEAHELIVLDLTGDTKIIWDAESQDEIDNARRTFEDLLKKGYTAYKVGKKGEKGEVIRTFDPEAEKLILAPRMVGG